MKYAVVRIKGTQYRIKEGDEVLVDSLGGKKPEVEVLLVVDGEKVQIGKPVLEKAIVEAKSVKDEKGKKIYVFKFKSKSRYRRKTGYRHLNTRLQIGKIKA